MPLTHQLVLKSQSIGVMDTDSLGTFDGRLQIQQDVIVRWMMKLAADFGHDQHDSRILQLPVAVASRPQHLDPPDFEIIQVGRVVGVPLGVSFLIPNADLRSMLTKRKY